jgi:5-methyltetrahydrofolate--homocysteine methyltransferase
MLLKNHPLTDLIPLIDWSFFFAAWEVKGRYPDIFDHPAKGKQAKALFDDAQQMLDDIVHHEWLQANAIAVVYPANSRADDIVLYADDSRADVLLTLPQLRNQELHKDGSPNLCLSDFIAPEGTNDYIAAFALTTGIGLTALADRFRANNDDYRAIMAKALADRLAEAFAEYIHREVALLMGADEQNSGIRPAFGYPACPDHSTKRDIFDVMNVEQYTGISLTENYMMMPETSVSGIIITNPAATYFSVGKIDEEQLHDYARRKKMPVEQLRRLLANNLM